MFPLLIPLSTFWVADQDLGVNRMIKILNLLASRNSDPNVSVTQKLAIKNKTKIFYKSPLMYFITNKLLYTLFDVDF